MSYPWNQFHRDTFEYYRTKTAPSRQVDCAPRGYAKSTVKTLFKPVHDICYSLQKYILFIADTTKQSGEKLKDIRSELLDNDLLRAVYGVGFQSKRPGSESFEVTSPRGTIFLRSVSSGTSVRGFRYKQYRPTKIILDDAEDSEKVLNEEIREKTENWFFEDIVKLGSEITDIEIVGTVLHRDSLLMKLKRNPAYTTKIYKAVISWADNQDLWNEWRSIYQNIDNDYRAIEATDFYKNNEKALLKGTKVLWPEKEPYLMLMKEMEEIGKRAFMKEKQNSPMPTSDAIFDNIWWYHEDTHKNQKGFYIEKSKVFIPEYKIIDTIGTMDPATGTSKVGNKSKLDFTAILGGYKDTKGRLFVHKDFTKRVKPSEYIKELFEMHWQMDFNRFGVETNLFRGLLIENLIRERKRLEKERKAQKIKDWGVKVPFYEILNREKKTERIVTLEPKVNNGWILFNRSLSHDCMEQIEQFPSKDMHDDAPDGLEMLWGMANNRYKVSAVELQAVGSR